MPNYLDERGLAALWEKIKSLGVDKANIIERLQTLPIPTEGTPDLVEVEGILYAKIPAVWGAPTITLTDSTLSTDAVEGVTKYKIYSDGSYVGYVDADGTWHEEAN